MEDDLYAITLERFGESANLDAIGMVVEKFETAKCTKNWVRRVVDKVMSGHRWQSMTLLKCGNTLMQEDNSDPSRVNAALELHNITLIQQCGSIWERPTSPISESREKQVFVIPRCRFGNFESNLLLDLIDGFPERI